MCCVCVVCVCVFDLCKKSASTAGPAAVIQAPMAIGQMSLADLGSGKPSQEKLAEFNEINNILEFLNCHSGVVVGGKRHP